jgi:hypothetical protein
VKKIFFSLSSFNECYYANGMCRESPKHECLHGITTFPSQFQSNSIISCETEQSNITHDPLKGFSVMQRDEMQEKRGVGEGNGRRTAANFMAVALLYRRCKRTSVPTVNLLYRLPTSIMLQLMAHKMLMKRNSQRKFLTLHDNCCSFPSSLPSIHRRHEYSIAPLALAQRSGR